MSAIALVIGPLLNSQHHTQAKVDTVQAAAMALYRIQRDLRNTDSGAVYSCTTGASPSCATPGPTFATTSAIVISTAYLNGTGQFQLVTLTGKPKWQGATVYWVDSAGNLDVAFDTPSPFVAGQNPINELQAAQAVSDVTSGGGMQIARFVEQLSLAIPPSSQHRISFQLQARSTVNGALNETTYQTDSETRN